MRLGDEVYVISLNRKVDQAEVGAAQGADVDVGTGTKRDVKGEAALVLGTGTMQDDGANTGLAPSAGAAAAPRANGKGQLALVCHLD